MNRRGPIILTVLLAVVALGVISFLQREAPIDPVGRDIETIVLADAGWDSIRFHNSVVAHIIEHGYGYQTDVTMGSTPATLQGLANGDIQVYTELWTESVIDFYTEAIDQGSIIEASVNFNDNAQGLYVPTYVIEGDPTREIEPMAPGLLAVTDLPEYWEVFRDPEDHTKGRFYGSIPGWEADNILQEKFTGYGLDETFNYFRPGSEAALNTSLVTAIERGEAWVGYNWEPTWIIGLYDMTLLQEPEFDEETWRETKLTAFPAMDVVVAIHSELPNQAPRVTEFLQNYQTSSEITAQALAYFEENNASAEETAIWFFENYEDVWTTWVPEDVAEKVRAAL